MNPILLDLGLIKIYWYSFFIFIGMMVAGILIYKEARKFKIEDDFITDLFFWDIFLGIIGARIYYVIFNLDLYKNNIIDILKVWEGGLAIHGGIILGLLATLFYTKKNKKNFFLITDIIVVGLIIAQAIGRWGNFFNSEAYGTMTTIATLKKLLIPGFIINGMNINGNYYLPMFYYESLWCLLGFIFLLFNRKRKYLHIGQLTSVYMIWYGFGRFIIEIFRTDSLMIGNLKMAQIVSIIMILFGIILYLSRLKDGKFDNLYNEKEVKNE